MSRVTALKFNEIEKATLREVGSKSLRCWELFVNGFPVPAGLCVLVSNYESHIKNHGVEALITRVMEEVPDDPAVSGDIANLLHQIREKILGAPLEEALIATVRDFLASLPGTAVSVRSSGTLEDLGSTSYAGQYKTCLNQTSLEDVCQSIKACWASMWEPHILSYRATLQKVKKTPQMGVLVQHQVNSTASGVVFTKHPITLSNNEFVIESLWGQGDGLVSGTLTPDRFVWDRHQKQVSEQVIANKEFKVVLTKHSGTETVQTSPEEATKPSLTLEQLTRLATIAEKIANHFNYPQDIEWALENDKLYLLQSRAITTTDKSTPTLQRQTSFVNNRPVFYPPGPGLWECDSTHFQRPSTLFAQEELPRAMGLGMHISSESVGLLIDRIAYSFVNGFPYTQPLPADPADIPKRIEQNARYWNEKLWKQHLHSWDTELKPAAIAKHLALQRVDMPSLSDEEFLQHLEKCYDHTIEGWRDHHIFTFSCLLPVGDFFANTMEWTKLPLTDLLPLMQNASPASRGILAQEETKAFVAAIKANEEAKAILNAADTSSVIPNLLAIDGPVKEAMERLLERNSCTLVSGYDISSPVVMETPEILVRDIRVALEERSETENQKKVDELIQKVRNLVPEEHYARFDELLADALEIYRLRDERGLFNDLWATGILRHALLEAGARLTSKGVLTHPRQAIDASRKEMGELFQGTGGPSPAELDKRAGYRERHALSEAPVNLGVAGPPPPLEGLPPHVLRTMRAMILTVGAVFERTDLPETKNSVRGAPASRGVVQGTARVVLSPEEFSTIQSGDIIVAYSTSASFNVVLPLLAGIVTVYGGVLSHAAIVAREFGLPCVVSCINALDKISSGTKIRVDGTSGIVTILGYGKDAN